MLQSLFLLLVLLRTIGFLHFFSFLLLLFLRLDHFRWSIFELTDAFFSLVLSAVEALYWISDQSLFLSAPKFLSDLFVCFLSFCGTCNVVLVLFSWFRSILYQCCLVVLWTPLEQLFRMFRLAILVSPLLSGQLLEVYCVSLLESWFPDSLWSLQPSIGIRAFE